MKISMDKKYQTRGGLPVRIYAVDIDDAGGESVHGAIETDHGLELTAWYDDGYYYKSRSVHCKDLVEVPERVVRYVPANPHGPGENRRYAKQVWFESNIIRVEFEGDRIVSLKDVTDGE